MLLERIVKKIQVFFFLENESEAEKAELLVTILTPLTDTVKLGKGFKDVRDQW